VTNVCKKTAILTHLQFKKMESVTCEIMTDLCTCIHDKGICMSVLAGGIYSFSRSSCL